MTTNSRADYRFSALKTVSCRRIRDFQRPRRPDGSEASVSEFFGCNTFGWQAMKQKLPESDIALLREVSPSKRRLSLELADKVAIAVKEWALSKGATHYCHWFQPQTGATAEKHDAFFSFDSNFAPIEKFTGKLLIKQEPDASSFPSGGRRSTFEARGYTAWDATSPMFLMETNNGLTLCIPSVFISYSGESLDQKTPLLRSLTAVGEKATEALHLLGEKDVSHVVSTVGPEQEYFVVDKVLHDLRPDLVLAQRTLMGRVPPRGQQLDDHYFGAIKSRVLNFMIEAEYELFKLGVPCKTRHNEVAPAQYETAPIFEFANIASDHNQLVMEVFKTVALRHGLVVKFHEKPYADMNGSGKHLNWSLADNTGENLLEPGKNPAENIKFLYFCAAAIKAVHDWSGVLRSTVASAGNDFRLGANEAPPAIMSVFLGKTLSQIFQRLGTDKAPDALESEINLDLDRVAVIDRDDTDRNRTSPFAFTGNKFEFRALGASQSVSYPAAYLNAAMATALGEMNESLKAIGGPNASREDVIKLIKKVYEDSKAVHFDGDGYSEKWHNEAEKRGLLNLRTTPEALKMLRDERTVKMLIDAGIYEKADELESRYSVLLEQYNKTRMIEIETAIELVNGHVLPAAYAQMNAMGEMFARSKDVLGAISPQQKEVFEKLSNATDTMLSVCKKMSAFAEKIRGEHDEDKQGEMFASDGMELLAQVSDAANEIELLVDDHLWSLPKYRELIFAL